MEHGYIKQTIPDKQTSSTGHNDIAGIAQSNRSANSLGKKKLKIFSIKEILSIQRVETYYMEMKSIF